MEMLYTSVKEFLKEPFHTPMSFWQYSAIVGLTLIIIILWTFVLRQIIEGVEEI